MGKIFNTLKLQLNYSLLFIIFITFLRVGSWSPTLSENRKFQGSHRPTVGNDSYFQIWRNDFLSAAAPRDETGLIRGIFLGEANFIPQSIISKFRTAGLTHVIAASGFNCWIVGFLFLLMTKVILLPCKNFLHPSQRVLQTFHNLELLVMAVGAWLFFFWTNRSPPVTRAVVMISARNTFRYLQWPVRFTRLLIVQYFLSLCIEPKLFSSASFQLTFACLTGIVASEVIKKNLIQYFKSINPRRISRATEAFISYLLTNFGICLSVAPITWIFFAEINFTSLLTNWFVGPPVAMIIMPLGLTTMLSLKIFPAAAGYLCSINNFFCKFLSLMISEYLKIVPHLIYAPYRDF